jgi:hypothetical protein
MLRQSSAVAVTVTMAAAVVQPLVQVALHIRVQPLKAEPGTEGAEIACSGTTVETQVSKTYTEGLCTSVSVTSEEALTRCVLTGAVSDI